MIGCRFRTFVTEVMANFAVGWRWFGHLNPLFNKAQNQLLWRCQARIHAKQTYSIAFPFPTQLLILAAAEGTGQIHEAGFSFG